MQFILTSVKYTKNEELIKAYPEIKKFKYSFDNEVSTFSTLEFIRIEIENFQDIFTISDYFLVADKFCDFRLAIDLPHLLIKDGYTE